MNRYHLIEWLVIVRQYAIWLYGNMPRLIAELDEQMEKENDLV